MLAAIRNGSSRGIMGKRVLLVEDDASLARSIVDGLSDEGFTVAHAADGDAAREALRAGGWDLVILDWWLPGPDGLEVLEGHRREGGTTPVLFLTARDAVSDRVRGLDGGADDYLCKPFAFEELLARARALIRRVRPGRGLDALLSRRARGPGGAESRAGRPSPGPDGQGAGPPRSSSSAIPTRSFRGHGSTGASGARTTTSSPTRWKYTSRNSAGRWRRGARG